MRIHEILTAPEPLSFPQEDLDEDLKSIRNKAVAAVAAGGLAFGANAMTKSNDAAAQAPAIEQPAAPAMSKDALLLAQTIWAEARSHGEDGMRAVGHVVMNRMSSDRNFGDTIDQVVHKRKHFSCWNPGDPNGEAIRNVESLPKESPDYKAWEAAQQVAQEILSGKSKDPTNGALFYHTDGVDPNWNDDQKPVAHVANHTFYRTDAKA